MKQSSPLTRSSIPRALLFALAFAPLPFHAQSPPEWYRYSYLHSSVDPVFALTMLPGATQWVRVEISDDLSNWNPLVNLDTARPSIFYADDAVSAAPARFYRLISPGTTVDQARALWQSRHITDYQYQIQNVAGYTQRVFSATVAIHNGLKTITGAQVNFESSTNYSPADFPSVDELFDRLDAALTNTERMLEASYNLQSGYPWRCHISDPPLTCSISNFLVLTPQPPSSPIN